MASSISGGSYFKTGIEGMKIAAPAFVVPWLFLYNPNLLANFSGGVISALTSIAATVVLIFSLLTCLFGYLFDALSLIERAVYFIVAALLTGFVITLNIGLLIVGIVLFLIIFIKNITRNIN